MGMFAKWTGLRTLCEHVDGALSGHVTVSVHPSSRRSSLGHLPDGGTISESEAFDFIKVFRRFGQETEEHQRESLDRISLSSIMSLGPPCFQEFS